MMFSRFIWIGVAGLVIALATWGTVTLLNNSWIELVAPAARDGVNTVDVTLEHADGSQRTLSLKAGQKRLVFVKTGPVRIDSTFGSSKAIELVQVSAFNTTHHTISTPTQRAMQKLGSAAEFCPVAVGATLYSHGCGSSFPIYRHTAVPASGGVAKTALFGGRNFNVVVPVKNGFLAFLNDSGLKVNFLNPANQQITALPLTSALSQKITFETPDIVGPQDSSLSRFALVFKQSNEVYLFNDITDTRPVRVNLGSDVNLSGPNRAVALTITDSSFLVLEGVTEHSSRGEAANFSPSEQDIAAAEEEDKTAPNADKPAWFFEYDTAGKRTLAVQLPNGVAASGFYKLTNNFYAAQTTKGIDIYSHTSGKAQRVTRIGHGASIVQHDGRTYIQADGNLYQFSSKAPGTFSFSGVFASPAITASELFVSGGQLLFTGYTNRLEPAPLDVFRILTIDATTRPLEEQVSAAMGSIMTGYDYDDTQILFTIKSEYGNYPNLPGRIQARLQEHNVNLAGRAVKVVVAPPN